MTFRVGQKVVCVNNKARVHLGRDWVISQPPVLEAVYTIADLAFEGDENTLILEELSRPATSPWRGYAAWRFRPIVERKTDIGFAHEILRKVSRTDRVRA